MMDEMTERLAIAYSKAMKASHLGRVEIRVGSDVMTELRKRSLIKTDFVTALDRAATLAWGFPIAPSEKSPSTIEIHSYQEVPE